MKIDRTILSNNDQAIGMVADPDKLEASIKHIADVVDTNDDAKTDKTGDHQGTWNGMTIQQAAEPINGARLDTIEANYASRKYPAYLNAVLQNGWANYGDPYHSLQYRKLDTNEVRVRGWIRSGTVGLNVCVLPAGYRPGKKIKPPVMTYATGGVAFGSCELTTDGALVVKDGNNTWVNIDFTFDAEL